MLLLIYVICVCLIGWMLAIYKIKVSWASYTTDSSTQCNKGGI